MISKFCPSVSVLRTRSSLKMKKLPSDEGISLGEGLFVIFKGHSAGEFYLHPDADDFDEDFTCLAFS